MKKRVTLVFEEEEEESQTLAQGPRDQKFNIRLTGLTRDLTKVPENEMSAAEFWPWKLMMIARQALKKTGSLRYEWNTNEDCSGEGTLQ